MQNTEITNGHSPEMEEAKVGKSAPHDTTAHMANVTLNMV